MTMPVFYRSDFVGSAYEFDTTRKSQWIVDSLNADPIEGLSLQTPALLDESSLVEIHAAEYVAAVRTGRPREIAESQGFAWDPGLWTMVCASNGGAVASAFAALRQGQAGSLSSGLHHARRDRGSGYCTFNGLVLAGKAALDVGAARVLILDLDAHCGGGTHCLIEDDPRIWHTDISVSTFDQYAPTPRCTLDIVSNSSQYIPTLRRRLEDFERQDIRFDLCVYNAGMDPFERCTLGGLRGVDHATLMDRERVVFQWCRSRGTAIAFVLAGGYIGGRLDRQELVRLHRLTLSAAAALD